MATLEKLCARGVYDPPGYSQLIPATVSSSRCPAAPSLLFLAGQVPYAADGGVDHPGDFLAQDIRYRMDFHTVRDEFFGPRGPASTFLEVCSLSHPDYMIELEAIAVI